MGFLNDNGRHLGRHHTPHHPIAEPKMKGLCLDFFGYLGDSRLFFTNPISSFIQPTVPHTPLRKQERSIKPEGLRVKLPAGNRTCFTSQLSSDLGL